MAIAAALSAVCYLGSGKTAAGSLSAQWTDQDIGAPAVPGSAATTPSGFTVTGGGTDIWGSADEFHFVYQQIRGDVDVRARVDSIGNTSDWAKAGVMIRGALTASAAHGLALVSATQGTAFQRRLASGGTTVHTGGPAVAAPEWVRLLRRGTTVSAYASADGANWTLIGSDTVQLGASAYVGLAVTSHNPSAATTSTFSQVAISSLAMPAGQLDADIGAPAIRGNVAYDAGTYRIHAGGADIWGTSDQFHYVYQPVNGDVDVAVRVASLSYADPWSKAGVMIRETLSAGSRHAFSLVSAAQGYAFQRRPSTGGTSLHTSGLSGAAPGWLRLKRAGSLFTAYRSADGLNWSVIASDTITMAEAIYVGIAVTSHSTSTATDAVADSFKVTQTGPANQPPTVSIASPANNGTFTAPASITITANASDPENQLAKVDFYHGATPLGSATAAPYSFVWTAVPAGSYALTAVAWDAGGLSATSAAVSVTVAPVATSPPTGIVFTASPDDATVSSYRLDVFPTGADPNTASPLSSFDAGHPPRDANGEITVSAPLLFSALAPGNYQLTVSAVNAAGSGRSAPIAFTR